MGSLIRFLSRERRTGFSLIEAILASFLLVGAFFIVSRLFQTGLQYSNKVERRLTAVHLAEKRMLDLREWARDQGAWNGFPDGPDADFPTYDIKVTIDPIDLLSPGRELESLYPGDRRVMSTVARRATVLVSWAPAGQYRLTAYIAKAAGTWRANQPIVVTRKGGGVVGPNEFVEFTAQAFDSEGKELKDIFFHWTVEPVYAGNPTTATVSSKAPSGRRDGRKAVFENKVRRRNGSYVATNGDCRVVAFARYHGETARGVSETLNLKDL